ncbi:MAG: putative sensor protein [Massilibacillus sp.]|nr:putative sensor protein [Massilibacillus sp.]
MASTSHVTIRKRLAVVLIIVILIMGALSCRLGYLQLYQSHWLSENAIDQRIRNIPVEARRGNIYDRKGQKLAVSISIESVYAIPAEIRDVETTAANLAAILDLDKNKLLDKLKKRQAFTWIARKVTTEQAEGVRKVDLAGIGLTEEGERYYPQDNVAAHVLGFTGLDSQGLDGVELTFDQYLRGNKGSIVIEYDAKGREIPYAVHRYLAPEVGNDVYLTLDIVIQQIVERELDKVMQETKAKGASIIAMDPYTGEILALANRPDYNPNHFAEYEPKNWRNAAISNAFEPGSTFKILTTTAALGEKIVSLNERFFDSGAIEVQGRTIHCWKHGGHGSETFKEVVENSCNTGFVTVGLRLGAENFYKYLHAFGLGETTGIDLPGEAKGIMIKESKVTPINLATMAMGQSIAVTPIQLIDAVCAVINGGEHIKPQIVREIKNKDGAMVKSFAKEGLGQVISNEVSVEVKEVLESVVANGTGKNAAIEGYRIGGKTGTAQKVGAGGYMPGKYIASFIGFAPADKPQIVFLVAIDEPEGIYYGGQIAAPVFKNVMQDVLPYIKN